MYVLCIKASHLHSLEGLKESKWQEEFGLEASPKDSWRTLYKPPIEKRTGALQWRIVHGIIATNTYRAHTDPQIGNACPFCGETETIFHLFSQCMRLQPLFTQMEEWCQNMGEVFSIMSFIYGPKYSWNRKQIHVLINFFVW